MALVPQVSFVAVGKWHVLGTDEHLSQCSPKLQCDFFIVRQSFHVGISDLARLSSTGFKRRNTLLRSGVSNELHVFLKSFALESHACSPEQKQSSQGVSEDDDMLRCVESALRQSAIRSVVGVKLIL